MNVVATMKVIVNKKAEQCGGESFGHKYINKSDIKLIPVSLLSWDLQLYKAFIDLMQSIVFDVIEMHLKTLNITGKVKGKVKGVSVQMLYALLKKKRVSEEDALCTQACSHRVDDIG